MPGRSSQKYERVTANSNISQPQSYCISHHTVRPLGVVIIVLCSITYLLLLLLSSQQQFFLFRECPTPVEECKAEISPSWVECKQADGTLGMYSFTQSCLYHNIYFVNGKPVLYFEHDRKRNGSQAASPFETMKNRDDFTEHFAPIIILIESIDALCETSCIKFHRDLSVLSDYWMGNIGHALFDSFYAIFVGLMEYSSRHTVPFRIINTHSGPPLSFVHDVITTLTPLGIVNAADFFSNSEGYGTHHLRELLLPNYARCMSCVNDGPGEVLFYGMGMGYELDTFRRMRAHTLSRYNLSIPLTLSRPTALPVHAIAVDNKRFTDAERYAQMSAFYKVQPSIQGKWVDWQKHGFRDQLRILSETHIYMSGSGTAIINQPFLPDGAVLINLGACNRFPYQNFWWATLFYASTFTAPIPGYTDQSIVASCSYHRALYYPLKLRCSGLMVKYLERLLREAEHILRTDSPPIPVKRGSNLAKDGLVVQELLRHDSEFRSQITDPVAHKACSTGVYFAPEIIMSENGPWSSAINFCRLNHTLLAKLKRQFMI